MPASQIARCEQEIENCRTRGSDPNLSPSQQLGAIQGECDWMVAKQMAEEDRYAEFLRSKQIRAQAAGLSIPASELNPKLFDWQRAIVSWALGKGKAAIFAGCGLGKTAMQLEWAHRLNGNMLILAPLAVAEQTSREGEKFGINVTLCRSQSDVRPGVNVTNYDILSHFDTASFQGVVLDESGILKAHDGSTRKQITEAFSMTPYRLCCTATPAPNDHMELGTHAEFLGVMTRAEMLSTFFVHDGGDTSKWRLKGHAQSAFWKWLCSWSVLLQQPSDLGYSDEGFILPPISRAQHVVSLETNIDGYLFTPDSLTLQERRQVRRGSLDSRVQKCAELVNASTEQWLVWCDLNDESAALTDAIPGAVEVTGSDKREHKIESAMRFVRGEIRVLISKPSIFGYGMNLQNCRNEAFVGLSDSFEQIYQAERRCWRFGQKQDVFVHVITSDGDGPVVKNIERKQANYDRMIEGMLEHMQDEMKREIQSTERALTEYKTGCKSGPGWTAYLGDCVPILRDQIQLESIDYSIFSPPFSSLYTYSASERDMGNSRNYAEFFEHYAFVAEQLFRVLKSGRLVSVHCMNLPRTKERDGVIGIRDFRGDLIRAMEAAGFIEHSEVTIWKDPVTAMQRTKAIGLLYKQLRKDSCMSRQGIPDYLVTFRKPGVNPEPVTKTHEGFPVDRWQRYASPVWMDIDQSDTLSREEAREHQDERHICALQLGVIERAIELWTNPDDLVLSPYMGIGSEGYQAIRQGRRFVGVELKESYWQQACINLGTAETSAKEQHFLFPSEPSTVTS